VPNHQANGLMIWHFCNYLCRGGTSSKLGANMKKAIFESFGFILINALFGITIIGTTIYCYARLDYVRSYQQTPPIKQSLNSQ